MYRGMEGSVWIEPVQERIVRIEGRLVKDVSFGWGIVGRLNKGGIYEIAQTQLSPGKWRITLLDIDLKGKMFLINSFRFQRKETNSRFHPVSSDMTFQEAVKNCLPLQMQGRKLASTRRYQSKIRTTQRTFSARRKAVRSHSKEQQRTWKIQLIESWMERD